jgi:hypothetical protein
VLAASSLAASFLGGRGFGGPGPVLLAAVALLSFVASVSATVFVLLPRHDLRFSPSAAEVTENLIEFRDDPRRLFGRGAAVLDRFWERNEAVVYRLARSLSIAVAALGVEVIALAALLGGTII